MLGVNCSMLVTEALYVEPVEVRSSRVTLKFEKLQVTGGLGSGSKQVANDKVSLLAKVSRGAPVVFDASTEGGDVSVQTAVAFRWRTFPSTRQQEAVDTIKECVVNLECGPYLSSLLETEGITYAAFAAAAATAFNIPSIDDVTLDDDTLVSMATTNGTSTLTIDTAALEEHPGEWSVWISLAASNAPQRRRLADAADTVQLRLGLQVEQPQQTPEPPSNGDKDDSFSLSTMLFVIGAVIVAIVVLIVVVRYSRRRRDPAQAYEVEVVAEEPSTSSASSVDEKVL